MTNNKSDKGSGVSNKEIKSKLQEMIKRRKAEEIEKREKKFKDKLDKITSNDIETLNQSLNLANEILANQEKIGESASKRINTFFAVGGLLSGLFTFFIKFLNISTGNFTLPLSWFNIALIMIIFKMGFYFFSSIRVQTVHFIRPNIIYSLQKRSHINALRYEIAEKIENYHDRIRFNSDKVYCLEQMQNNLIVIVALLILIGFLSFLNSTNTIQISLWYLFIIWLIAIFIAWIFDFLYIKLFRKFWR